MQQFFNHGLVYSCHKWVQTPCLDKAIETALLARFAESTPLKPGVNEIARARRCSNFHFAAVRVIREISGSILP
jgi:hypothetical protein